MQKIRKTIGVIFLLCAAICSCLAFRLWNQYEEGNEEYEELIKDNTVTGDKSNTEDFQPDWDALRKQNPDIVGWIRMDPTVNYPVVKGNDNREYLHRGFHREYNINGSIFMHYQNATDWSSKNTILYGHNMNNKSMFGNNALYKDKNYAKAHPYFYIYTEEGRLNYHIFDTITVRDGTAPYQVDIQTEEDFESYLSKMNQIKDYGLDVDVSTKDRIVSLSTCTQRGTKRFVIQGVLESFTDTNGTTYTAAELNQSEEKEKTDMTFPE